MAETNAFCGFDCFYGPWISVALVDDLMSGGNSGLPYQGSESVLRRLSTD